MYAYLSVPAVFLFSLALLALWLPLAKRLGLVGHDVHKPGSPMVPEMGGVVVLPALLLGLALLQAVGSPYAGQFWFLVLVTGIAWLLGLVDDLFDLAAVPKLLSSLLMGIPIFFFFNPFNHALLVPFLLPVRLHWVYPLLALALIAGTANALNSYDVVNGSSSSSSLVIAAALSGLLLLQGKLGLSTLVAMVGAVSLSLFILNAYPSKVFLGDTGSFSLGAALASASIVSGNESFLFIALLPMIVNSAAKFMSARKIYESHRARQKLTFLNSDGKIQSYGSEGGISLLKLLAASCPIGERQAFLEMSALVLVSTLLALATVPALGVPLFKDVIFP